MLTRTICLELRKERKMHKYTKPFLQVLLCALAIGCIAYGCMRGEAEIVLSKGIKLCLECVGIG